MNQKTTILTRALLFCSFCFSTSLLAQKNCDLELTLVSPTNNQNIPFTVESNDATKVYVKFNVKNNGPDAIAANDTLYYMSEFSGTLRMITGASIASGATYLHDPQIFINNAVTADQTIDYCLKLFAQTNVYREVVGNDTTWVTHSYTDPNTDNDKGCASVNLKKQTVGIFDVNSTIANLNVYPNPAQDVVNFNINLEARENVTVKILDATGRVVMTKDFGTVQAQQETILNMDIKNISSGLYFIDLTAGDYKAKGKVTKK
jgi:hypothetical protein